MMRVNVRHDSGFTLIELLVVMAISMFVLVAASKVMINMTSQFKQQTRISEKSIESGMGLEMLRKDMAMAGFGLPTGVFAGGNVFNSTDWAFMNGTFLELDPAEKPGSDYENPDLPPRMLEARNPVGSDTHGLNGSSYLIVRSAAVGTDPAAGKFYMLKNYGEESGIVNSEESTWNLGDAAGAGNNPYRDPDLADTDQVIVITTADKKSLGLVTDPQDSNSSTVKWSVSAKDAKKGTQNWLPKRDGGIHIVYGISSQKDLSTGTPIALRAPFNRVDYYVGGGDAPEKCATGTGVLYRAQMMHKDGMLDPIRVMDCVAMMQVEFYLDLDSNDYPENQDLTLATLSAETIRKHLKRIDVYLLTHEGQFDPGYEYLDDDDRDGVDDNDGLIGVGITGIDFDAATSVGDQVVNGVPYWKHYRWRVFKVSGRPVGKGDF